MLDRADVERALDAEDWATAFARLRERASAEEDEGERWRIGAMAGCAKVISVATGRDAAVQVRELVRLADGHLDIPSSLLASCGREALHDVRLGWTERPDHGVSLVAGFQGAPFDVLPDLRHALQVDPVVRRNARPEVASAFLRRLSPYDRFSSDGQKAALHAAVTMPGGGTLIASLPTGWGKSAVFQVAARWYRESDPTATVVVIVPTVALAQDHARTLATMAGLEGSRALVGGMKAGARRALFDSFAAGEVPILLLSPEMALDGASGFLAGAAARAARGTEGSHLAAVVVDEAHIISSWGRYFRPDFQRLSGLVGDLRSANPALRTLLLSATLDADLRRKLGEDFCPGGLVEEVAVAEPRSEFDLLTARVPDDARMELVLELTDVLPRPAVVYTTRVEDAEVLFDGLCARGYKRVELFTGQLDSAQERQRIVDSWANGNTDLVVATSAFGMGVDKPNVRAVVHACIPETGERLYQEIGRGGRDGHQAMALCLWTDGDVATAVSMATHGWMTVEMASKRWRAIVAAADSASLFATTRAGGMTMKVPLDTRHDDLPRVTGRLNRQWNMALLTQLQRAGAVRILGEEKTDLGAELWVAELLAPEIVEKGVESDALLGCFLTTAAEEVSTAFERVRRLEAALRNEWGRCFREALFELVDPTADVWPCGRCISCREADERPHDQPDPHAFLPAWGDVAWGGRIGVAPGSLVLSLDQAVDASAVDRLVPLLAALGIEQFLATPRLLDTLSRRVSETALAYGFVSLLGGGVPPARMPTVVLVDGGFGNDDSVREDCIHLRVLFERNWPELPVVFIIAPDVGGKAVSLSQHLSCRAPIGEAELVRLGRNA